MHIISIEPCILSSRSGDEIDPMYFVCTNPPGPRTSFCDVGTARRRARTLFPPLKRSRGERSDTAVALREVFCLWKRQRSKIVWQQVTNTSYGKVRGIQAKMWLLLATPPSHQRRSGDIQVAINRPAFAGLPSESTHITTRGSTRLREFRTHSG